MIWNWLRFFYSELKFRKLSLRAASEDISNGKIEYDQGTQKSAAEFEDDSAFGRILQVAEPEKQEEESTPADHSVSFELLDKLDVKVMLVH